MSYESEQEYNENMGQQAYDEAQSEQDYQYHKYLEDKSRCLHSNMLKEYSSQPYGTCLSCGITIFNQPQQG